MAALITEAGTVLTLLALHRSNPVRYPYLLQSSAGGRYDILFACPGQSLVLDANGQLDAPEPAGTTDFLSALDGWWLREQAADADTELPFRGGWFLYLGYELAGQIEPRLQQPAAAAPLPVAFATRMPGGIVHDHATGRTVIIAESGRRNCWRPCAGISNALR